MALPPTQRTRPDETTVHTSHSSLQHFNWAHDPRALYVIPMEMLLSDHQSQCLQAFLLSPVFDAWPTHIQSSVFQKLQYFQLARVFSLYVGHPFVIFFIVCDVLLR